MMKRVGFCNFKQFDVGRKMSQCLRIGGVNANGDVASVDETIVTNGKTCGNKQLCSVDNLKSDNICECQRVKGNILSTIKRKWRKNKRNKNCENRNRSDTILNICQNQSENCDGSCLKHYRLKKQKPCAKTTVTPVMPTILHCNGDQSYSENDERTWNKNSQQEIVTTNVSEDNEECSCFGSPSRKVSNSGVEKCGLDSKSVQLQSRTSRSLSDLSSSANVVGSSRSKTDSEGDVCQISSLIVNTNNNNEKALPYANTLCIEDEQNNANSTSLNALQNGQKVGNLTHELYKLSKYGWYWGPINRSEAESKLVDQPDGAFLVRDSSDDRYILSLSFRSYGKTLHTRIEHSSGLFSFYSQPEPEGHQSIVELIQQSMCYSQSGVFCYSRSRSPGSPSFPVRLTKPISRFNQVRSLQYLCRFVIRQYTRYDHIQKLPLPPRIKGYLEEGHY